MSTPPIRIAFDASCLIPQPLTGVGYYTLHQLEAVLATQPGVEIRLFASSAQPVSAPYQELAKAAPFSRFVTCPTRLKSFLWTRLNAPKIERYCGEVDIVHGGFHLLPASHCRRRVVTVFDLAGVRQAESRTSENIALHMRILRLACAKATAIVAISESCKQDVVEILNVPQDKVHVVYGGVQLEEFSGALDLERLDILRKRFGIQGPYFIYLSTLEPRKNMPRLIEAYARIRVRHPDAPQLVIAGRKGWLYDEIFSTVKRLKLENEVIFTDYLDRADAVTLLKGAYACTYPSLYEGFGLPVLEAMAARVPVLTSNVSSLPEVAGDTALLVNPESVDAMEAGLENLLTDYDSALGRLEAAYARATQFTWDASAAALAKVYRHMMDS